MVSNHRIRKHLVGAGIVLLVHAQWFLGQAASTNDETNAEHLHINGETLNCLADLTPAAPEQ